MVHLVPYYIMHYCVATVCPTPGIQFSVTPSPNITTLQSAVFRCFKDEIASGDTLSVHWTVGELSISSPSWQSYSTNYTIIAEGVTTQDSTLTITGDSVLNGTVPALQDIPVYQL